jgi:hypothetical protein
MPSRNGDFCTICKDPSTLPMGSSLALSADNPKKRIAFGSLSFCTYSCSVSRLRWPGVHLKLSVGITLGESHLRVPLDSSPSNTSLKSKSRYISAFPARALRWRRDAFGCRQILTSFATGHSYRSGKSRGFQLAAANFPLSSINFRASSE